MRSYIVFTPPSFLRKVVLCSSQSINFFKLISIQMLILLTTSMIMMSSSEGAIVSSQIGLFPQKVFSTGNR